VGGLFLRDVVWHLWLWRGLRLRICDCRRCDSRDEEHVPERGLRVWVCVMLLRRILPVW
jgi:hypothetical protein